MKKITLDHIKEEFEKYIVIKDKRVIDVIFGTLVANFVKIGRASCRERV